MKNNLNGSGVRFDEQLRNLFDSMMKRGYGGGLPWWDHRGFNQVSDGMKMKKSYALFNPLNDNPNQIGSRGLWGKMLSPVKRGYGNGFGFGDYDSGNVNPNKMGSRGLWSRGFGDGGYGTPFATMKKRGWKENSPWWAQYIRMKKMKRGNGAGFGFGDFNSGKRGFGGATFDHGFGNSFATMKKRGGDQYIRMQKMKRGYGAGFGFGDYDSGKRGFGGATFDHGFGNSFSLLKYIMH